MRFEQVLVIAMLFCAGAPVNGQSREWTVAPSQRIGVVLGDPGYEFDRILSVARSADGVVAVGQMNLQEVRLYGPDGRLVASQGRDGEGPGEYRYITDMVVCGGERFHVYDTDLRRTTVVTSGGDVVRMYPGPLPDGQRGPYDVRCDFRGRVLASSWPMGEMEALRDGASGPYRGTQLVVLMDEAGTVRDTVGTFPSGARYLTRRPDGSPGGSGPRTFGPGTHIALGHGRAFVGDAATATVYVYEGRGLDTLRLPVESARIPDADIAAYTESRVAAVGPERAPAVRRALAEYDFPDTYPYYSDLVVDETGLLWVQSYPRPGDETVDWLVMHPEGGQVARVVLPVAFTAMQIGADYVLGVLVEDDVNFVQRYALERPSAPGDAAGATFSVP